MRAPRILHARPCPAPILEEARLHPAIRERRQPERRHRPQRGQAAASSNPVLVVGMAGNPHVRRRAQAPRRRRHRPPLPRVRQLLQRLATPQRAEDVDRLADLSDGLRQGHAGRRREPSSSGSIDQRRAEAHARRMSCGRMPLARRAGADRARAPPSRLVLRSPRWRRAAVGAAALPRRSAGASSALSDCHVAGIRNGVLCGSVQRPLDPARPQGAQIDDPLRRRAGDGAAQAARPGVPPRRRAGPERDRRRGAGRCRCSARLNNRRDIVFVDQRGTGRSAPLRCARRRARAAGRAGRPRAPASARCASATAQLLKLPTSAQATCASSRPRSRCRTSTRCGAQLGAERINLVGASTARARRSSTSASSRSAVRRSVLDGVAPPDMALPASFSTDNQAALDALLAACAAEPACARATPTCAPPGRRCCESLPRDGDGGASADAARARTSR